jgi:hypothetical protein
LLSFPIGSGSWTALKRAVNGDAGPRQAGHRLVSWFLESPGAVAR